ncbi:hypothetical protein STEG23_037100 [Scotinomys teguina]
MENYRFLLKQAHQAVVFYIGFCSPLGKQGGSVEGGSQLLSQDPFAHPSLLIFGPLSEDIPTPRLIVDAISKKNIISYNECITQVFALHLFGCMEIFVLILMAVDRYVAICKPLRYPVIMSRQIENLSVGKVVAEYEDMRSNLYGVKC